MKTSESLVNFAPAFVGFSSEVERIEKDRRNPHFKNDYATLDQLIDATRPILAKYGLAVTQSAAGDENGNVVLTTRVMHTSGEWQETEPLIMKPVKTDPQGMGSATTYARRYQYAAALNLSTGEDDDGNDASGIGNTDKTPAPDVETRRQNARQEAMNRRNSGGNNSTPTAPTTPAETTSASMESTGMITDGQVKSINNMTNVLDRKYGDERVGSRLLGDKLAEYGKGDLSELTFDEAAGILSTFNGAMRNKPTFN